jgi:hypothetical protein
MAKTAKKATKKATKKVTKKVAGKKAAGTGRKVVRKTEEQQKAVFGLMKRANGATLADIKAAGYNVPAMAVIAMAERHGFKTKVAKSDVVGERTRYLITGTAK